MPTSITLAPALRRPSASAAASSGPDRRPSRPIANVSRPRSRASVPRPWPTARTIAGGQRPADDAADVVGLEDFAGERGHACTSYEWENASFSRFAAPTRRVASVTARARTKPKIRCGSQSRRPGAGPVMKPTCPPVAGCSSRTTAATSCGPGSDDAGNEGIVARVEHERRHLDGREPGLRRRARPVVVGAREAVQRRGDDVVEVPHRAHARDARRVERAGKASCHGERLRLQRRQEVPRVDAVQALADRDAGGHEVERHGHGGRRDERARAVARPRARSS